MNEFIDFFFYLTKNSNLKDEKSCVYSIYKVRSYKAAIKTRESNKKNKKLFISAIAFHINEEREREKNRLRYIDRKSMKKKR